MARKRNLYSYPIEDYWISGRVIFTNGNTQIPEFAKEGLPILKNKTTSLKANISYCSLIIYQ